MDGLEATRRIRALPGAHGQVPILALTAYTYPGQVAQCREAGMDGHITKPVDYETLISAIDDAIARIPRGARNAPPSPPNKAEEQPTPPLSSSPARSEARVST